MNVNQASDVALMRELDIIGDRERGIPGVFPVSKSYFRGLVREGAWPAPVKVGKLSFWRRGEVLAMIAKLSQGAA